METGIRGLPLASSELISEIDHPIAPDGLRARKRQSKRQSEVQWTVTVSLEFDLLPVLTWRGMIRANQPDTAIGRGIRAAKKAYPNRAARSWCCVAERQQPIA